MDWGIENIRENSVLLAEHEMRQLGASEGVIASVSKSIQHWINSAYFEGALNESQKQIESFRSVNESLASLLPPA